MHFCIKLNDIDILNSSDSLGSTQCVSHEGNIINLPAIGSKWVSLHNLVGGFSGFILGLDINATDLGSSTFK